MERNLDRIAAALELIAAHLALIAAQLDPAELERRKVAMLEQIARDLGKDSEKKTCQTGENVLV